MAEKVIVFGLDGFTWKTLDYLKGQFEFKNLERLRSGSAWGKLESTIPPSTIPAWVSFATGCNPGKHGVFDFIKPDGSLRKLAVNSSADVKVKTIQQIVADAGKKSVIINLPLSTPARTKDITIGSFMSAGEDMFSPKSVAGIPEVGAYRVTEVGEAVQDEKEYLRKLGQGLALRIGAAKRLAKEDWDYFFVMFSETDFMQHAVFDQIKSGKLNRAYRDEVFAIYRQLDDCLGWFMENRGESSIVVMSDHGFEAYEYCFSLLRFLEQNNALTFKKAKKQGGNLDWEGNAGVARKGLRLDVSPMVNFLEKSGAGRAALDAGRDIYIGANRFLPLSKFLSVTGHIMVPDPEKSKAMPVVRYGYSLFINSKERFPDGIVEKSEPLRQEIMEKLSALRSDYTGKSPFRFVMRPGEAYSGPYVAGAPDILIGLDDHAVVGAGNFGKSFAKILKNYHDRFGIFVVHGKGITPGFVGERHITDIAPTVLALLGIPAPEHMDGRPIAVEAKSDRTQMLRDRVAAMKGKLISALRR
ncbi:MAG TPA: alkaline phosphatase family protein [Candidatus Bilamarchaeum sp.]|nr:alkaline phosphatase family protein [Candidatus Bilamarchaeum sp.]